MKRILFIDDDNIVLETFKYLLSNYNYDVTICNNSIEGLNLALNNDYELIITDYHMPNITGIELIKKVKLQKKNVSIILASGYLDDDIIDNAYKVGALSIMHKPFDLSKIVTLLGYL